MRKIVFSFDDALQDFYVNALPIFENFGFKVTINIITKYSEAGMHDGLKYMNIKTLGDLKNKGNELACHSDSHLLKTTKEDFDNSLLKMNIFFGNEKYGAILPFSQKIDDTLFNYFKDKYLYLADYPFQRRKNNFYYYFCYFFGRIFRSKKLLFYYCNYSYFYDCRKTFYTFKRLPIKKENNAKLYISLLKHMPNSTNLTLMFHSIVRNKEKTAWGDGEWDVNELTVLLKYIKKKQKKYKVVVQKEIADE